MKYCQEISDQSHSQDCQRQLAALRQSPSNHTLMAMQDGLQSFQFSRINILTERENNIKKMNREHFKFMTLQAENRRNLNISHLHWGA